MAENEVVFKVTLQGADQVSSQLAALGAQSEATFGKIDVQKAAQNVEAIAPSLAKAGDALKATGAAADTAQKNWASLGETWKAIKQSFSENVFAKTITGLKGASEGAKDTHHTFTMLGQQFRALGHLAEMPELSRMGMMFRALGHAAPITVVAGLEAAFAALGAHAASANDKIETMAAKVSTTPAKFRAMTESMGAAGVKTENMAKVVEALPEHFEKAGKTQDQLSEDTHNFEKAMNKAQDSTMDLMRSGSSLDAEQRKLTADLTHGKITIEQFNEGQMHLNNERAKLNREISKSIDAEDELRETHEKNRKKILEEADAITKLGISVQSMKGSGLDVKKGLDDVYAGLMRMPEGAEKTKAAFQIFGNEAKHVLDVLKGGPEALHKWQEESEKLHPHIDEKAEKQLNELYKIINQVKEAWSGFIEQLGIKLAPESMETMKSLKEFLIWLRDNIPTIVQWITAITGAVKTYIGAFYDWFEALGEIIGFVLKYIIKASQALNDAAGVVKGWMKSIKDGFTDLFMALAKGLAALYKKIDEMTGGALTKFGKLIDKALQLLGILKKDKEASDALGPMSPAEAAGMAGGGRVYGPGSSTSDSIMARLSAGEWVIRAAAVQRYGDRFMHMVNSMSLPTARGFAMGGPVGFAGGGSPRQVFNLTIGGETFGGMTAPQATANRLVAYAVSQQMRSAGRKPTWYGS